MSTADYAQADGRWEKINQTTLTICRQMISYNQSKWDEILTLIKFAINSHQSEGTGVTPFKADMGREPRQPLNLEIPTITDDFFVCIEDKDGHRASQSTRHSAQLSATYEVAGNQEIIHAVPVRGAGMGESIGATRSHFS